MIFFLFLHENICCGYSLEVPDHGTSNEHPKRVRGEIRKNLCGYPLCLDLCYIIFYGTILFLDRKDPDYTRYASLSVASPSAYAPKAHFHKAHSNKL